MTLGRMQRCPNYSASAGSTAAGWPGCYGLAPFVHFDKAIESGVG